MYNLIFAERNRDQGLLMKEPALTIHKVLCFNRGFHPKSQIAVGSFKTIPKSLKQLPVKN